MTNDQMKAGRFLRWAIARRKAARIVNHLRCGKRVVVATPLRAWVLTAKHANTIKATRSGLYMQRGNAWDCIDYCALRFEA